MMQAPDSIDPHVLRTGEVDVVRVGGTRVTLDTVVQAFREGLTAKEIQKQYPVLDLPVVSAAIAWNLRRRDEVEAYLEERARRAARVRREVAERFDQSGIRERLLARRGR